MLSIILAIAALAAWRWHRRVRAAARTVRPLPVIVAAVVTVTHPGAVATGAHVLLTLVALVVLVSGIVLAVATIRISPAGVR